MKPIRHGDVNLFPVTQIKGKEIRHNGSFTLAKGEATGSKHVITCDDLRVYREIESGDTYISLGKVGVLTHTHDHETLEVPAGTYIQVPEREVDHFAESVVRKVID